MTSPQRLNRLLAELGLEEAATFTAVRGADQDAVIRLFGGDPAQARPMKLEELREHCGGDRILVSQPGPAVVVVEDYGFEGWREEVLRPLSRLGRAASAYWSLNAGCRLSLAEDGLIASALDTVEPEDAFGARPETWAPLLEGLDLDAGGGAGGALAALERATGARFNRAWMRGTHRIVEISPVPDYLLGQHLVDSPLLNREPFLSYLADLGPAMLGRMRRHALDLALAHAGLGEHPLALAALSAGALPVAARERLQADLIAASEEARPRSFAMLEREPEEVAVEWERASHLVWRQAIVFDALAQCVTAHLPNPSGCLPDIVYDLGSAMTGEGERVEEFSMVAHLHDAARRAS
ncbi:DUF6461 domain-containing protein [Streptomyces spectabilis]|uniref:DUF6461 domain-containing protein n=1 Tax=Streptomyces spectabilis TaxID=68270 RepID=UPI00340A3C67